MSDNDSRSTLSRIAELFAGVLLFFTTAAVVCWQNTRLTVLYDLCGVLENATRISQGQMPYRDFPFPYAPLTFLTQAAIIKLTGAVYWHHILYCCMVAGLATVVTWRILSNLFCDRLSHPRLTALILSLPLSILGIYCIFPHPFYDPDAAFVILLCILLALHLEKKNFPPVQIFLLGALLVAPMFIKQNIGLVFFGSVFLCVGVAMIVAAIRKHTLRPYLIMLGGSVAGFLIAIAVIHFTADLDNYQLWTVTYAAARRTPSLSDMLSVYADWMLVLWTSVFLAGAYLFKRNEAEKLWRTIVSITLMSIPFIWPVAYLLLDTDASERAERLVGLWPMIFIVSIALAYIFVRRFEGFVVAALPFVLISTAHGVFLSQQLWGSTYAIWPFLIIVIAIVLLLLYAAEKIKSSSDPTIFAAIISLTLIVAGGFYVYSNERLDYVDFEDGDMAHSTLPQLQGLSMRGSYIPDFEELVRYTDENIPRDDGILLLPGEDLFYYTTGRYPKFPVLLFDVTNNPYNADEIREKVLSGDIEWIIVKNDLQIEEDQTIDDKDKIFELRKPDFKRVESLNNYEIYRRKKPGEADDEDDDSDDDSSNSDN